MLYHLNNVQSNLFKLSLAYQQEVIGNALKISKKTLEENLIKFRKICSLFNSIVLMLILVLVIVLWLCTMLIS